MLSSPNGPTQVVILYDFKRYQITSSRFEQMEKKFLSFWNEQKKFSLNVENVRWKNLSLPRRIVTDQENFPEYPLREVFFPQFPDLAAKERQEKETEQQWWRRKSYCSRPLLWLKFESSSGILYSCITYHMQGNVFLRWKFPSVFPGTDSPWCLLLAFGWSFKNINVRSIG